MFKFTARTHRALIARHAIALGLECTTDPNLQEAFNITCSCENDRDAFDRILEEQGFGLNALTWKVTGLAGPDSAAVAKVPEDATWQRISGGGSYVYLIRPLEAKDPKVYGVKELS